MIDTNSKPQNVTYPIPANDDGVKSIKMIVNLVVEAIKEGKTQRDIK
jgi:small subunit ribosomal protein S2